MKGDDPSGSVKDAAQPGGAAAAGDAGGEGYSDGEEDGVWGYRQRGVYSPIADVLHTKKRVRPIHHQNFDTRCQLRRYVTCIHSFGSAAAPFRQLPLLCGAAAAEWPGCRRNPRLDLSPSSVEYGRWF